MLPHDSTRQAPELPPGLTLRRPRLEDAEAVAELMRTCDLAEIGEAETDADDVRNDWSQPRFTLERDTWVVASPDGALQAYAWVWDRVEHREMIGDVYVRPGSPEPAIDAVLCARVEERAAEHLAAAPAGEEVTLGFFALMGSPWDGFLGAHGFPVTRTYFRMEIALGDAAPVAAQIPGIEIRAFRPGLDEAAIHRVIQESFAEHYMFAPERLDEWISRRRAHAAADPLLWLIAWEGAEPVGAILPYPFQAMAWIRELGVRAAWRSKGVGRALLLQSFRTLHERGQRRIALGVDASNATGATRLYESAGMRVSLRHHFHRKLLREGRVVSASGSPRG